MLHWSHAELTAYCLHHRKPNYLTDPEYTACILTIALINHYQNSWINQEEHTPMLPPHLDVLTPGGHLLILFSSSIIYL